MNVLAIIPARGGSKGIPRKNLRQVDGLSLVAWAVRAAREATTVTRTVVSSDDPEILREAARCGAMALTRREDLADDTASTDAVLLDVLATLGVRSYEEPDLVVLLQPTVPVRRPGLVDDCVRRLLETRADSLLTAYPLHFVWRQRAVPCTGVPGRFEWVTPTTPRVRRQDMPPQGRYFHEDGAVYVTRAELLRKVGQRVCGKVEVFETERTVDIDVPQDLVLAEALLQARRQEVLDS